MTKAALSKRELRERSAQLRALLLIARLSLILLGAALAAHVGFAQDEEILHTDHLQIVGRSITIVHSEFAENLVGYMAVPIGKVDFHRVRGMPGLEEAVSLAADLEHEQVVVLIPGTETDTSYAVGFAADNCAVLITATPADGGSSSIDVKSCDQIRMPQELITEQLLLKTDDGGQLQALRILIVDWAAQPGQPKRQKSGPSTSRSSAGTPQTKRIED